MKAFKFILQFFNVFLIANSISVPWLIFTKDLFNFSKSNFELYILFHIQKILLSSVFWQIFSFTLWQMKLFNYLLQQTRAKRIKLFNYRIFISANFIYKKSKSPTILDGDRIFLVFFFWFESRLIMKFVIA